MTPRGKRTNVHGSYRELEDTAINPLTIGVHTDEHYKKQISHLNRLILIILKTGYGGILYHKIVPS